MLPIPTLDALVLSGLFGAGGLLHMVGPAFLRHAYRRWRFPSNAHRVAGVLQILTALFLSNPVTRIWGVILAGFIIFFTTVALLNRGKYAYSVPGLLLMLALVPASLAGPL
ncbi:MAG: DoxX family protein [Alphaproteobacteria bacterium]|nr:DoxX family protein [Alphaproteobacteria bacterium]